MIVPTCSSRSARVRLPSTRPLTIWTESMCRATTERLKGVGMRGEAANAEALMALEALDQSGEGKADWTLGPRPAAWRSAVRRLVWRLASELSPCIIRARKFSLIDRPHPARVSNRGGRRSVLCTVRRGVTRDHTLAKISALRGRIRSRERFCSDAGPGAENSGERRATNHDGRSACDPGSHEDGANAESFK